jgi:hypothetical protein
MTPIVLPEEAKTLAEVDPSLGTFDYSLRLPSLNSSENPLAIQALETAMRVIATCSQIDAWQVIATANLLAPGGGNPDMRLEPVPLLEVLARMVGAARGARREIIAAASGAFRDPQDRRLFGEVGKGAAAIKAHRDCYAHCLWGHEWGGAEYPIYLVREADWAANFSAWRRVTAPLHMPTSTVRVYTVELIQSHLKYAEWVLKLMQLLDRHALRPDDESRSELTAALLEVT